MSHRDDFDMPQGAVSLGVELSAQVEILEAMFSDPGLQRLGRRSPTHPAVRRHRRIKQLVESGGWTALENETSYVLEISEFLMDRSTWANRVDRDDYWSFLPDEKVKTFVRTRMSNPELYDDVITELFMWGWLKPRIRTVISEDDGNPDLCIGEDRVWAEVKRIHRGSLVTRIGKVINKASNQIKNVDPHGSGVALIYIERETLRASFDDRVPSDVKPFVEAARRALSGSSNRNVAIAVILWDDYSVISESDEPALYYPRRRSMLLKHAKPRKEIPIPDAVWSVSRTVSLMVAYESKISMPRLPKLVTTNLALSQMFRAGNELTDGIRFGHVLEIVAAPDGSQSFDVGDTVVTLVTREIVLGPRRYVTLLLLTKHPSDRPQVDRGFKLFGSDEELARLATHPVDAFQTILSQFALTIRVGDQEGVFIAHAVIPRGQRGGLLVRTIEPDKGSGMAFSIVRPSATGTDVWWAFAVDRVKYRESF